MDVVHEDHSDKLKQIKPHIIKNNDNDINQKIFDSYLSIQQVESK